MLAQTLVDGPRRNCCPARLELEPQPPLGSGPARLGHFELEAEIGRGGMGSVYAAMDRSLGRRVAIKILPQELAAKPAIQARFLREARAQARLSSAHVAHIYYVGQNPAFFAMELVEGGTLHDVLERGETLDPERARRLMIEIASGLRAAHEVGLVHRDIKPSNLLLDKQDHVKIADFGVAKLIEPEPPVLTLTGAEVVIGTPLYMAPEQARGDAIDHRADMYSLGCSFFHLLAGAPPFVGSTPLEVISRHLSERPPRLSEIAPAVPQPLAVIIERLLQKDRERRYSSYDELIAALQAASPESTRARRAGFWTRAAAAAIDTVIAAAIIRVLGWPGLALHLGYVTLAHSLSGQSFGKWLMQLELQCADGQPLGLARSLLRTITSFWLPLLVGTAVLLTNGGPALKATIERIQIEDVNAFSRLLSAIFTGNVLASALYLLGLLLAALHPEKRAAHDMAVGSRVVYRLE